MQVNQILTHRSTPGHGYFRIAHKLNLNVPEEFRQKEYEEDCDWAIPLFFNFKLLSSLKEKKMVISSIKEWRPNIYLSTGRKLKKGDSRSFDEATAHQANKGNYFLAGEWGDTLSTIPEGLVFVNLRKSNGGFTFHNKPFTEETTCLVSKDDYEMLRKGNYVPQSFVDTHQITL